MNASLDYQSFFGMDCGSASKRIMGVVGVPLVPGYHGRIDVVL